MVRDSKMGNFAATCKNFGFSDIGDLLMMACHGSFKMSTTLFLMLVTSSM